MNISDVLSGQFDGASENVRDGVMELVAYFHYRDMKRYPDGSIGTIEISPKQLNDLLAYCYGRGFEDGYGGPCTLGTELSSIIRARLPREPHG